MEPNKFKKPECFTEEQFDLLQEALTYLSIMQRRVIYLRFWKNHTINEVSRIVGIRWQSTDQMIDSAVNHMKLRVLRPDLFIKEDEQETFEDDLWSEAYFAEIAA